MSLFPGLRVDDNGSAVVAATQACAIKAVEDVNSQLWTPFEFQAVKRAQCALVEQLRRQCNHTFRVGYVWEAPSLVLTVRLSADDSGSVDVPDVVNDSRVIVLPPRTRDDGT